LAAQLQVSEQLRFGLRDDVRVILGKGHHPNGILCGILPDRVGQANIVRGRFEHSDRQLIKFPVPLRFDFAPAFALDLKGFLHHRPQRVLGRNQIEDFNVEFLNLGAGLGQLGNHASRARTISACCFLDRCKDGFRQFIDFGANVGKALVPCGTLLCRILWKEFENVNCMDLAE
jgi:hypothetical protein